MSQGLWPLLAFMGVVLAIPVVLALLRRTPLGRAGTQGPVRLVAVLPLAPQQKLLTVEVGQGEHRQWLVLGATATQINLLHTLPAQPLPEAGAPGGGFAAQLAQRLAGGRDAA
jgi:flagellar protein FliO/FliZ